MLSLIIVIVTSLVSVLAFRKREILLRFDLSPSRIINSREYYRLFTHAFLHADYIHLIINMLVLYSFGIGVEAIFERLENQGLIFSGKFFFILLYAGGILLSSISTVIRKKDNPEYSAVGASGAVSAVVFTYIFFAPLQKIYFYMVLPIPGIIFGVLYIIYSSVMGKRGKDNINHEAHFWGAIYGFIFPILIDPKLINTFWNSIF